MAEFINIKARKEIKGKLIIGDGQQIINIDASKITKGNLSNKRLNDNVPFTDSNNNFSGTNSFNETLILSASISTLLIGNVKILSGTGSPENNITAPVGSLFLRTNGGANTTLYVKESGSGNTGWVAK